MNWSGIELRTPRRQAGDYPPEPLHEFNNSNLYLRVLTKEGVKTVSATTPRKIKIQDWKSGGRMSDTPCRIKLGVSAPWHDGSNCHLNGIGHNLPHFKGLTLVRTAFFGYYAASCGNFLPTFRANLSVPSLRIKNPKLKPDILVRGLNSEQCCWW
jgi:hypothetical protein